MEHILKTWKEPFQAMKSGLKPYELRLNDRDYKVGDTLILAEYLPHDGSYTGDHLKKIVTYIMGKPFVQEGYVIMSVTDVVNRDRIPFPILNGLTPTTESCTMKVLEEVGELMQLIGKGQGKSGEERLMSRGTWAKLSVREAIDTAQSAITMAQTICKENGLDINVVMGDHEDKMRAKGYLK